MSRPSALLASASASASAAAFAFASAALLLPATAWAGGAVREAPVALDGPGPFFRLTLPVDVPLAAATPDLRDLRVLDAAGASLSFALVAARASATDAVATVSPKWVPLYATAAAPDALTGFRVERRPDGTVTAVVADALGAGPSRQPRTLRGYLLEVPDGAARCTSLELDWYRKEGGIEQLSVEASDDLGAWRPWRRGATIASLEYGGQRIEKRTIDLPGQSARYVRMTWESPSVAPELVAVKLSTTSSVVVIPETLWSLPMAPTSTPDGALDVDLGHDVAVSRVRIDLAEDNTLAPVEVWATTGDDAAPRFAGRAVVYRLRLEGRTWEEREVSIALPTVRKLSVRPQRGGHLGAPTPSMEIGVAPISLVLLARGEPPYSIRVGDLTRPPSSLDVATLVPGWGGPSAPSLSEASVDFARARSIELPAPPAAPKTVDPRPYVLWAVLGAGVLALIALALKVLREATGGEGS